MLIVLCFGLQISSDVLLANGKAKITSLFDEQETIIYRKGLGFRIHGEKGVTTRISP